MKETKIKVQKKKYDLVKFHENRNNIDLIKIRSSMLVVFQKKKTWTLDGVQTASCLNIRLNPRQMGARRKKKAKGIFPRFVEFNFFLSSAVHQATIQNHKIHRRCIIMIIMQATIPSYKMCLYGARQRKLMDSFSTSILFNKPLPRIALNGTIFSDMSFRRKICRVEIVG